MSATTDRPPESPAARRGLPIVEAGRAPSAGRADRADGGPAAPAACPDLREEDLWRLRPEEHAPMQPAERAIIDPGGDR